MHSLLKVYHDSDVFCLDQNVIADALTSRFPHDVCFADLTHCGIIKCIGNSCYLNFRHPLVYIAKLQFDAERLYFGDNTLSQSINAALNELVGRSLSCVVSAVLVGSCARGTHTPGSDIDILVVSHARRPLVREIDGRRVEIIRYSPKSFATAVRQQDEFAFWAFKYGLILRDSNFFCNYVPTASIDFRLLRQRKHSLIEKMIYGITLGINSTRTHVLQRRIVELYEQIARAVIIERGSVPRSARELFDQASKLQLRDSERAIFAARHDAANTPPDGDILRSLFETIKIYYYDMLGH